MTVNIQLNIISTCIFLLLVKHRESHPDTNRSRWSVRPGPNDHLFMRGTKLSELSLWKFDVLGRVKFVWMRLDRPTHSIRQLHTDRTSEDHLREKRWSKVKCHWPSKFVITLKFQTIKNLSTSQILWYWIDRYQPKRHLCWLLEKPMRSGGITRATRTFSVFSLLRFK